MKTGGGRKDTVPYKTFNKEEMLDEVLKMGFYSAWNDIKSDVQAYDGIEMLVVADHEEKYGENWYICLTEAAKEAVFYVSKAFLKRSEDFLFPFILTTSLLLLHLYPHFRFFLRKLLLLFEQLKKLS